ncbi:hypothetical protein PLICRDRAFT_179603 [Plicaturopsis crispa FD-325 SS-3]|uniref:Uncharacterized protein n=1 Tax=Plicaturopsis crispa FD-325 SS-3 TaxID=944288 RepID=A0A0C9SXF8_PLICR|nr:hypothetical protein PLICRDRAFT_179603 [Plicaturopsis crispa FD-325 SS-3]
MDTGEKHGSKWTRVYYFRAMPAPPDSEPAPAEPQPQRPLRRTKGCRSLRSQRWEDMRKTSGTTHRANRRYVSPHDHGGNVADEPNDHCARTSPAHRPRLHRKRRCVSMHERRRADEGRAARCVSAPQPPPLWLLRKPRTVGPETDSDGPKLFGRTLQTPHILVRGDDVGDAYPIVDGDVRLQGVARPDSGIVRKHLAMLFRKRLKSVP